VYQVTNLTSGAILFVQVFHPNGWKCETLPALVLVPGGIGWSANFTDSPGSANILANTGFAVVIFDPDGHGRSQGSEDYDGFAHQDGLGSVINFTTGLPEVDKNRIGLISFSYGITMASGTLSRYPDLPVIFLIDWEGPADRYDTTTCCDVSKSRISWKSCDDEGFWRQREALTFIAKAQVPYQRIQSEKDHVQPDVSHAVNMINVALSGSVPWARLNDFQPNQTYYPNAPPVMIPETQSRNLAPMVAKYAQKMLLLFGQWGVVVWNHSKM
jgi:pimeloyl-ACP methyl ester carboxylesterase